jgi:hypothetical protein
MFIGSTGRRVQNRQEQQKGRVKQPLCFTKPKQSIRITSKSESDLGRSSIWVAIDSQSFRYFASFVSYSDLDHITPSFLRFWIIIYLASAFDEPTKDNEPVPLMGLLLEFFVSLILGTG